MSGRAGVGIASRPPGVRTAPAITGDPRLGGVLRCGRGDWDEPDEATYPVTYQWLRDAIELGGETTSNHTVAVADVQHAIRCDVTATSSGGTATAHSATLYPPAPLSLTIPGLGGDPRFHQTLSCSRGTWNDDDLPRYPTTRTWLRDGAAIAGQTAATYTLTSLDVNRYISCRMNVGALASATSVGAYAAAPRSLSVPDVTGDPRLGGTLSCARGIWDDEGIAPYAVTKQWLRDGVDIIGAVGDGYTVASLDVNHAISCRVRAEDLTDATSAAVYGTPPTQRSQPVIEGDPRLGRSLTCTRGTWDDQDRTADYDVSYEWYRSEIFVADTASYDVTAADVNSALRCQVVAEGLATASSPTIFIAGPDNNTVPVLAGDGRLGRTLSCSRGDWDDDEITPYAVEYQWLRNGVEIAGVFGSTHTLTLDDVNTGVGCRVTAAGFTAASSTTVFVQAPLALISPHIEGDPRVGEQLTCTRGDWDDAAGDPYDVTYQWFRSSVEIGGATDPSYTLVDDDLNQYLYCGVRAEGFVDAYSPLAYATTQATGAPPVILVYPTISGDRRLRHAVTCNRGSWNDTAATRYAVTYRWRRNSVAIAGATSSQYTIAAADIGQSLTCDVTAAGQTTASAGAISGAEPRSVGPPSISGDPRLRRTLACSRGDWDDDAGDRYAVTYRWLRNGVAITGATAATYLLTEVDTGTYLYCEVRAESRTTASSGGVAVTEARVLLGPAVSGDPRLRRTLTCSRGTWDDIAADRYAVSYQWMRNGNPIDAATGASYTLTPADVDTFVTCVTSAEDQTSASSVNGASVSAPRIIAGPDLTGYARLRQSLACSRGEWDDIAGDRYAVSYRWLRDGVAIAGAAVPTYTAVRADVNHSLSCSVRAEGLTDASSRSISVTPPRIVIAPTVEGVPRMFRELTCSRGEWDDTAADRYAVSYLWMRNGVEIPGATQSTYTAGADDVNMYVSCRVRAEALTDSDGPWTYVYQPGNILSPAVTGQAHLRGEVTCSRGTWDDTAARRYAVSYQWYRNFAPINGATEPSYLVGVNDVSTQLTCSATAEGLTEAFGGGDFVSQPSTVAAPMIEGIAHAGRALTCARGEWNDSAGRRYAVSYRWLRSGVDIPGADSADYLVTAEDVGAYLSCVVTAEGNYPAQSFQVFVTWQPLQLGVVPDADAVSPSAVDGYSVRVRNPNPTSVSISTLDLTLPGGFAYQPGTTSGALTVDPTPTGPGALTLRWSGGFSVPALGDAVVRLKARAASQLGDHFASARAFPADNAFTIPATGPTARITVEGADPSAASCTILGTEGPDVLQGTPGADVICGFGGDDRLFGADGADQLWGGPGDDRLDGGAGADALRGGDGADVLDGGLGGDLLVGGGGIDTLTYASRGQPVTVTLGSGTGNDGAAGEGDTAGSDIEIVRGGSGADDLTGGLGADELYGRGGDDRLTGGHGAGDLLDGGDGSDTLVDDDGQIDVLICGGGIDAFAADVLDRIVGCETPFSTGVDG